MWANLMIEDRRSRDELRRAEPVVAVVADDYDGGAVVPIRYHNPFTDQAVDVEVYVFDGDLHPRARDRVDILVAPDDPEEVSFVGDRYSHVPDAVTLAILPLIPLFLLLVRARRLRWFQAAMGQPGQSFAMTAALGSASRWGRRAVLHLYALDAPPGGRPVCTVPLLDHGELPVSGVFPVEVKGVPRPLGRVIACAEDVVLWPAGRAAMSVKAPRPFGQATVPRFRPAAPPGDIRRMAWRWRPVALELLLVIGALVMLLGVVVTTQVNGDAARAMQARAVRVVAEVVRTDGGDYEVEVRYRLPGDAQERTARAPVDRTADYEEGRRYPVLVDPQDLSHARMAEEPYNGFGPVGWALAGVPAAVLPFWNRARAWREARRHATTGPWREVDAWRLDGSTRRPYIALGPAVGEPVAIVAFSDDDSLLMEPSSVRIAGRLAPGESITIAAGDSMVVPASRVRAPREREVRR